MLIVLGELLGGEPWARAGRWTQLSIGLIAERDAPSQRTRQRLVRPRIGSRWRQARTTTTTTCTTTTVTAATASAATKTAAAAPAAAPAAGGLRSWVASLVLSPPPKPLLELVTWSQIAEEGLG